MILKIGAVAELTGLSPNGIRFYEEKNLVSPGRNDGGSYRSFGPKALSDLMGVKNYRNCGFSLEESAAIQGGCDVQKLALILEGRAEEVRREADERLLLCEYLRSRAEAIRGIGNEDRKPSMRRVPELAWLPLEQDGGGRWPPAPRAEVCAWLAKAPFVDSGLLFDPRGLEESEGPLPSLWGLAIELSIARRIGFEPGQRAERFGGGRCAATIVEIDESLRMTARSAAELRRMLAEEGFRPSSFIVSRRLANLRSAGEELRYDEAWVPFE